jgi:TonB-linked SusC/RagA family outer membrane protein
MHMKKPLRFKFRGWPQALVLMLLLFVICTSLAQAQSVVVTGKTLDEQTPLPGVSIMEKGTNNGTVSDADGNFTLKVSSSSSTLVCSFIGYKTIEIPVENQTTFTVNMSSDITALNEVVVTALGIEREIESLGYAVQKVEGKDIVKAREPNVINSLTGRVAGLEIRNSSNMFQDPAIRLRGVAPLIVIDGIPSVDGDIWKINADDIESYSVLKGATASALYGSIGRNGAIMITTKRGSRAGTSVEVNSSTMFQPSFIRIPEVQTTYGNGNNGKYTYVNGSGSGLEGAGWIWGPKLNQKDPSTPSGYWETPQYNSPVDPVTGELVPLPFISRGKDNVKNFFETGMISTNNVSVSSGNEHGNFRVSASHVYQKGIVPNTQLNSTSFGVSGGYKLAKGLKTDASITYNRQYTDNFPEVGYGPWNYLYNLVLWTGTDVDIRDLRDYWIEGKEGIQQRHYNMSWYNNPYFQAHEYLQGYYKDNVFGQLKLDYTFAENFNLVIRTGLNQASLNRTWSEPKSIVTYGDVSKGNFSLRNNSDLNLNTDFLLTYKKDFSDKFNISVTGGGANRWRSFRALSQNTDGLVIPGLYNLSNSEKPVSGSNSLEEQKVNSIYGTIDMELLGGIFLGITGRKDWVSTLPVKNNSFFYPGVSLAGTVSEFLNLDPYHISFLKLRASWSKVSDGRIRGSSYAYDHLLAYNAGAKWNNLPTLTYPSAIIDPNIKPETSDSYEFGMQINFLNDRIGLDAAVYQVKDYNRLSYIRLSNASGFTDLIKNGGEHLRKGIELTLTATPVKTSDFTWDATVNWSANRRYLKAAPLGQTKDGDIRVGERLDKLYISAYQRTPGGQLILDNNGFPIDDPFRRPIGNSSPDWIFGVQNTFSYRNFSLNISVDGRVGGLMYSTTNQKMWWGGTHPGTVNQYRDDANNGLATYIAKGVVVVEGSVEYDADGNIVNDTRIYAPNTTPVNYITWNVETSNAHLNHYYNATFVKLREVTLTYTVPAAWLSKTFMKTASVSLVGRNLLLWSKLPEVDPDSGSDNLQTPSVRNMGFNLNLTF